MNGLSEIRLKPHGAHANCGSFIACISLAELITHADRAILVRRGLDHGRLSSALAVGFIALGMVVMADLAVGIGLRGLSATEVYLDRDPVSGAVYYTALLCFAVMPAIITHVQQR